MVIGVILVGLGISFPFIMQAMIKHGAKDGAALTSANENMWKGIPGNFDILIVKKNYVYNCTNRDDVIYKGSKPVVEEFGPYIYREYDDFTNLQYD